MSQPTTVQDRPATAASRSSATPAGDGLRDRCQQCGAPMDRQQRYCVNCAARRGDVANPASRYFAAAGRQRRQAATTTATPAGTVGSSSANGTRAAGVFFFALLPIAVAVGVLVGKNGSNADTDEVLAALREGGGIAAAGPAASGSTKTASAPTELLTSDFSLDEGYTVMIGTLPIDSTDQTAADDAKAEAEDKGAEDVGIINPGDYTSTPDQGQQDYILYSGEFKSKGEAEKALGDLKGDFADARVIEVSSSKTASAGGAKGDLNQNQVVAETSHGAVHEVSAAPPSKEQVEHDTQIVNDIANQTGDDYTDLQQTLPDVVVVGGDPDDAPPLPTGTGD